MFASFFLVIVGVIAIYWLLNVIHVGIKASDEMSQSLRRCIPTGIDLMDPIYEILFVSVVKYHIMTKAFI